MIHIIHCAASGAYTKADKRQALLDMKQEVLSELYRTKPGTSTKVANAPGYAVFSNANVNLIFASCSGAMVPSRTTALGQAYLHEKGGAVGGEILLDGVTVYQMTKSGLALQAAIKGAKY